jgi:phosphoglycolate phosphatase-like HAD superfamily hydrolase
VLTPVEVVKLIQSIRRKQTQEAELTPTIRLHADSLDIDGTLLLTQRAGVNAMHDAGRELFGEQFTIDGIEFAGRLDSLIWQDLVRNNSLKDGQAEHDRFRATYGKHLEKRLGTSNTALLLPGVKELVARLDESEGVTVGLLTGNYPETGRLKIRAAGLDPDVFTVAAWGIDGAIRRDLPPVAMNRHAELHGWRIESHKVIVIGDTPHDIDCAQAHGCRSIGVATGIFTVDQLQACGADLAVQDLGQVDEIVAWMLQDARPFSNKMPT